MKSPRQLASFHPARALCKWDAAGTSVGRQWDAGGTPVGRRWDAGGTPVEWSSHDLGDCAWITQQSFSVSIREWNGDDRGPTRCQITVYLIINHTSTTITDVSCANCPLLLWRSFGSGGVDVHSVGMSIKFLLLVAPPPPPAPPPSLHGEIGQPTPMPPPTRPQSADCWGAPMKRPGGHVSNYEDIGSGISDAISSGWKMMVIKWWGIETKEKWWNEIKKCQTT